MNMVCSAKKIEDGQQIERPDAWLEKGARGSLFDHLSVLQYLFGGSIYFEGKKMYLE